MHKEQDRLNEAHEEYELRGRRGGVAVPISAPGREISGTCGKSRFFLGVVPKGRCRNRQQARPRNRVWAPRPTPIATRPPLQFLIGCFQGFLLFSAFSRSLAGWLCQVNP